MNILAFEGFADFSLIRFAGLKASKA